MTPAISSPSASDTSYFELKYSEYRSDWTTGSQRVSNRRNRRSEPSAAICSTASKTSANAARSASKSSRGRDARKRISARKAAGHGSGAPWLTRSRARSHKPKWLAVTMLAGRSHTQRSRLVSVIAIR